MRRRTLIAAGVVELGSLVGLPGMAQAGMRLHRGAALAFGTTVSVALRHADAGVAGKAIGKRWPWSVGSIA